MTTYELFANQAYTTLNGNINNSTTSITVNSATGFPSSAQFRINIENEYMLVTAGAGTTTWTVTRGIEGSTAAAHLDTVGVTQVVTNGGLQQFRGDGNTYGKDAAIPSAAINGRTYRSTDLPVEYVDNGSTWQSFTNVFNTSSANNPSTGVFTYDLQPTGATLTSNNGILQSYASGSHGESFVSKALANTTPYTWYVTLSLQLPPLGTAHNAGIYLRDSTTNALLFYWQYTSGNVTFTILKATSITTTPSYGSALFGPIAQWQSASTALQKIKIQDDGTNILFSMSFDGLNYFQLYSVGRTAQITATRCGFYLNPASANYDCRINALSWLETNP